MMLLYKEGESRIKTALDVRKVIKTQNELNLLKHLLFRKQARLLLRLQRQNLLEFGGSESDESSLNDDLDDLQDDKMKQKQFVDGLDGWRVKSSIEKKLILGILHRKGHKNFEE